MLIEKGIISAPVRAVIYGPEGIGKSTLASHFPKPLFCDLESGTSRLAVDRVKVNRGSVLREILATPPAELAPYQTIVIDTADALDWMFCNEMCAQDKQRDIEGYGFGKGYTKLASIWESFLDALKHYGEKSGKHIVFVAHAMMRKFEQPDQTGTYDRFELKCMKNTSPLLKAWADTVLFVNYKTIVTFDNQQKAHASGAKRVIYTNHAAAWDAKNRFGFPDEMPLASDGLPPELARVLAENTPPATPEPPEPPPNKVVVSEKETTTTSAPLPDRIPVPETPARPLLDELRGLAKTAGISSREIQAEVAKNGVCPADMPIGNYNDATLRRIIGSWSVIKQNILNSRNH